MFERTGLRVGDGAATLKGRFKDGAAFATTAPVTVRSGKAKKGDR